MATLSVLDNYLLAMYQVNLLVSCPSLTNPNNGVINYSLGDNGVPSYKTLLVSHVTLVMS